MKARRSRGPDLVIHSVRVLTGDGRTREDVDVLLRDGLVHTISESRLDTPHAKVIDGAGKTLVPGLIDAHVHLDFLTVRNRFRAWVQSRFALPRALEELAHHGVTTIRCMADPLAPVTQLRKRAVRGGLVSPAILTAGPALTAPGGHPASTLAKDNSWLRKHIALIVDDEVTARTAVRRLHGAGVDLIKFVYQGGLYGPDRVHLGKLGPTVARAIIEEAHRHHLPVSAHTHYEDDVAELLQMGVDSVEHGVIEHALRDAETTRVWKRAGTRLVPTLGIAAVFPGPTGTFPIDIARANLARAYGAGVTIVAGTDSMIGAMPANGLHDELRHMVDAGISEADAIRAATADAAALLRLADRGVIEPGRRADAVLLGSDPLERIENIADIDLVIQDGTIIYDAPAPPPRPEFGTYSASEPLILEYLDRTGTAVPQHAILRYDRSRFSAEGLRTLTYGDPETGRPLRTETVRSDTQLVTREWTCRIPAAQTDLHAVVDGHTIALTGTLEGESVTRSYPLRGRIWMQLLLLDAATFISSKDSRLDVVAIGATGRGALHLEEFEVTKKNVPSSGSAPVEAALVIPRWRRFWGASAWFDPLSGNLLRQQIRGQKTHTLERANLTDSQ